jgi:hypothetical protein
LFEEAQCGVALAGNGEKTLPFSSQLSRARENAPGVATC